MTLTLIYFAVFRDLTGQSEERLVNIPEKTRVKELRGLVHEKYPLLTFAGVRVAVNEEFVGDELVLHDGDVVAFIPPVSGG